MEAMIMFMLITGLFAVAWGNIQAYEDKMRRESDERIAGWKADFHRRLDEFNAANPTASCRNCSHGKDGACRIEIKAPRHFCTQWHPNMEHEEALRMAALTDDQLFAEIGDAADLARSIKGAEAYLFEQPRDGLLRLQGARFLRLARLKLARQGENARA